LSRPSTSSNRKQPCIRLAPDQQSLSATCKPNHVGRARSEERPSFDGLFPAMTENDMEITG
jgi:hypothetical protein